MKTIPRLQVRSFARRSLTANRVISRHLDTMATARTIQVTPENTGLWHRQQTEAAAKKTTELLQEDLEVRLSTTCLHTISSSHKSLPAKLSCFRNTTVTSMTEVFTTSKLNTPYI